MPKMPNISFCSRLQQHAALTPIKAKEKKKKKKFKEKTKKKKKKKKKTVLARNPPNHYVQLVFQVSKSNRETHNHVL